MFIRVKIYKRYFFLLKIFLNLLVDLLRAVASLSKTTESKMSKSKLFFAIRFPFCLLILHALENFLVNPDMLISSLRKDVMPWVKGLLYFFLDKKVFRRIKYLKMNLGFHLHIFVDANHFHLWVNT